MKLNLQFFGEDDIDEISENVEDATTQDDTEVDQGTEDDTEIEVSQQKPKQSAEENSKYAAARRAAEAEIRNRDAEFARRFSGFSNPITGAPILSERDYFAALDAQEELNQRQQLEQQGIDIDTLNNLISNNPAVRQAQAIIERTQQQEHERRFYAEMQAISQIDPDIQNVNDLLSQENANDVLAKVNAGYNLVDAYKLVNFEKLAGRQAQASKQAAINAAKSKNHMTPTGGVADTSDDMQIPANQLDNWRSMYPGVSDKELNKKYTRVMNTLR